MDHGSELTVDPPVEAGARPDPPDAGEAGARWPSVVLAALLGLLLVAGLSLAVRPADLAIDEPVTEDGFYALSVSRSIADGNGVTIDGVNPTNGFQPLYTVLAVVPFVVTGDDASALRGVLVLHWATWAATAWVLSLICADWLGARGRRRRTVQLATALAYLGSTYVIHSAFNGLETGLVLLGYAVIWRIVQRRSLDSWPGAAVLGVVAGLTVLARIDAAFLVAALCGWLALTRRLTSAVIVGAAAVAVSSPWWIYNVTEFGSVMPSSGQALFRFELGALARRDRALIALGDVTLPWAYAGRFADPALGAAKILAAVAAVAASWWAPPRPGPPAGEDHARTKAGAVLVGATSAGLVAWYYATSFATTFYYRYFAPISLLAVVLLVVGLGRQAKGWRPWALLGLATASGVLGVLSMGILWNRDLAQGNQWLNDQVVLVERTVPEGEVVAAGQTGTLGFWRDDVVNLDGKVNPDVLDRQDDMAAYLDERSIDWMCDWPRYASQYFGPVPEDAGWEMVSRQGRFACWHRVGPP